MGQVIGGTVSGGKTRYAQTFTASGTWTRPAGVDTVKVLLVGGGGAGGSRSTGSNRRAGGGGGGMVIEREVTVTGDVVVTIGAGGTAPADGTEGNGGNGGNSTFGSLITAPGGLGGACSTLIAPPGATERNQCAGGRASGSAANDGGGGGGAGAGGPGRNVMTTTFIETTRVGAGGSGATPVAAYRGGMSAVNHNAGGFGGPGVNGLGGGGAGPGEPAAAPGEWGGKGIDGGGDSFPHATAQADRSGVANTGGGGGGGWGTTAGQMQGGHGGSGLCVVIWEA